MGAGAAVGDGISSSAASDVLMRLGWARDFSPAILVSGRPAGLVWCACDVAAGLCACDVAVPLAVPLAARALCFLLLLCVLGVGFLGCGRCCCCGGLCACEGGMMTSTE